MHKIQFCITLIIDERIIKKLERLNKDKETFDIIFFINLEI